MRVVSHFLHDDNNDRVTFQRSPNQSAGRVITPEYLVMHYTAGGDADGSIRWFMNPNAKASAHLVIARDGAITQMVAFNRRAWHAGASRWAGRSGLNSFSIGIELANAGRLVRAVDGWRTSFGATMADNKVIEATHKNDTQSAGWELYPEAQLTVARNVAATLARHYGLKDVLGHDDISPSRKSDPGPAFPMASFRSAVMGRDDEEDNADDVFLTTAPLNIRRGPGTGHDALEQSPLPVDTPLLVLRESGVWREVEVLAPEIGVGGWVHSHFIRPA